LAFVDDDVIVDPSWLRTLSRTIRANPSALAVTGGVIALRVDTPAQLEFERRGGFFKGWSAGVVDARTHADLPFNPSIGVGCNMAFRRTAFEVTGMFDEALDTGRPLAGGGDLDMLIRMAMAGAVVYEPSALVRHEHRTSFDDLRRQYFSWGKSWGAVLHKWYRTSSGDRPAIRRVAIDSIRHYVHDIVVPTRSRRYRSGHSALLLVGFAVGVTAAYPRSRRRMEQRRRSALALSVDMRTTSPYPSER
jgi:GT2 family glycosyltransferase